MGGVNVTKHNFPQIYYEFNMISIKISVEFCKELDKNMLKNCKEKKRRRREGGSFCILVLIKKPSNSLNNAIATENKGLRKKHHLDMEVKYG